MRTKRRYAVLATALLIVVAVLIPVGALAVLQTFDDVPPSDWAYADIEWLAANGLTNGCGDGTNYCPDDPVTRREMAAFIHRTATKKGSGTAMMSHSDWKHTESTTPVVLANINVNVPSSGFVIVDFAGVGYYHHVTATTSEVLYGISDGTSMVLTDPNAMWMYTGFLEPSGAQWDSLSAVRMFPVSGEGNYTYNVLYAKNTSASPTFFIRNTTLTATYVPNLIGPLDVASADGSAVDAGVTAPEG